MLIKILLDTRVNGVYTKAGEVVETDGLQADRLCMLGWAEAVEKKKASKKTAKKKD